MKRSKNPMKSTDIIPANMIDLAERKRACAAALEWILDSPRTWQDLVDYRPDWLAWAVRNLDLTALPEGLTVNGDLDLSHCPALSTLPEGLTVNGDLRLYHCPALTAISVGLTVRGSLYLSGCHALAAIPDRLTVGRYLYLSDCHATIPYDIEVGGKIYR
jgi:hypothetical protein